MTRELVNKVKNNIEATYEHFPELTESFWLRMSLENGLTERYIREFSEYLSIDKLLIYAEELTVALLVDFYKYLTDEWSHYSIFLYREDLSDEVVAWLIRNTKTDFTLFLHSCNERGKSDIYWENIFMNPNIDEEFKNKYHHMEERGKINIGDKVHTISCEHGIVEGIEGNRFIILDTDKVSDIKILPQFFYPECIYIGWENK